MTHHASQSRTKVWGGFVKYLFPYIGPPLTPIDIPPAHILQSFLTHQHAKCRLRILSRFGGDRGQTGMILAALCEIFENLIPYNGPPVIKFPDPKVLIIRPLGPLLVQKNFDPQLSPVSEI